MTISSRIKKYHHHIRTNFWYSLFTFFTRLALAAGFLPSGWVKITGERFTALSSQHPMGAYLDAFFHTGYYYTFVGGLQILAALLLLIPRTALLGVMIYFPIILNICVLSFAVRFDGSLFTAPLMVLACLYLFFWDAHKLKPIFSTVGDTRYPVLSRRFPFVFAAGVLVTLISAPFIVYNMYDIMPKNTRSICLDQCESNPNPKACMELCDCVHDRGEPWGDCLQVYEEN